MRIESPCTPPVDLSNKTIVQINSLPSPVHKIQIKNEFSDHNNYQSGAFLEHPQRKTSILISGDDCYSTVNVNDNVPLYQSSVVVNDTMADIPSSPVKSTKKSSTIYITGAFLPNHEEEKETVTKESTLESSEKKSEETVIKSSLVDSFSELNIPSSEVLKELLKDPVEAVRRNLVPHVCGKSDMSRRPRGKKLIDEVLRSADQDTNNSFDESYLR